MQTIEHARAAELVGEPRMFRVSAYYSPEPNQSRYLRGNYEAEIRLNGRGTNGADGTEVYPGMLAAPKNYPFGTQIYLPGLGIGTVHDRGGAIVPAGMRGQAHDRIDVWMGRGETGLARALSWGMRTVEGMVYWTGGAENSLSFMDVTPANLQHLPLFSGNSSHYKRGATGITIQALQKQLAALGHYSDAITGNFDESTEAAVLAFQLAENVIGNAETSGAGEFGPRTRASLADVVERIEQQKRSAAQHLTGKLQSGLEEGDRGEAVAVLQKRLQQLGYQVASTGEFGPRTKEIVQAFQRDQQVATEESPGFGVYGPQTHAALTELLVERQHALSTSGPAIILAKEFVGKKADTPAPVIEPSNLPTKPMLVAKEFPKPNSPPNQGVASLTQDSAMMVMEFSSE